MYRDDHSLWVEKYRPRKIDDCVLPSNIKEIFHGIVKDGEIPNLLLSGPAGTGKTTIAKALCNELNCDHLFLNASKERGIETIRFDVTNYSSTKSLYGGRKVVILDEADSLTPDAQTALRATIEDCSAGTSFIFTCNYKNRIISPLHSRCSVIEFRIGKEDRADVVKGLYLRLKDILAQENVEYNKDVLGKVILKFFPDIRRLLNELQTYTKRTGKIDEGILSLGRELDIKQLYSALKKRKYNDVREWVVSSLDNDPSRIYRKIYDGLKDHILDSSIPEAVLIIGDYQYKSSFSADQEICLLACLIRLMVDCEYV